MNNDNDKNNNKNNNDINNKNNNNDSDMLKVKYYSVFTQNWPKVIRIKLETEDEISTEISQKTNRLYI